MDISNNNSNSSHNSLILMDMIHIHRQGAQRHMTTAFNAVKCSLGWMGCLVHMGMAMAMGMRVGIGNHRIMVHLHRRMIEAGSNLRG